MKSVLIIGNRHTVAERLGKIPELEIVQVMSLRNSSLEQFAFETNLPRLSFDVSDKADIFQKIRSMNFDILVSHGCPLIFPVDKIRTRPEQILINVHPSFLPSNKGPHPINSTLLSGGSLAGVTMHYITQDVDGGNIIHQEGFELTEEVDAALLYNILFRLEPDVFEVGMRKLIAAKFDYTGAPNGRSGSYYRRKEVDQILDFGTMSTEEICRRVRAFGVSTQGCVGALDRRSLLVYQAQPIRNSWVLERFASVPAGSSVFEFDNRLLVRTADGLVSLNLYRWLNP